MVTGSTGFIAKNLISKLSDYEKIYAINRRKGWSIEDIPKKTERIVNIYADLKNPGWCSSLFRMIKPDIVFHLAAEQGRTPEAYEANVIMTSNLLKHCPNDCYFVYASSSTVYGDHAEWLKNEREDFIEKCDEQTSWTIPTSLYGASKLAGEGIVHVYSTAGKIKPLILRYVANVGKEATHGVVPDIIRKLKQEETLDLFGEFPGSIKPYMHVSDTVNATLHLVKGGLEGIYNISPADEVSINQIALHIKKYMNVKDKPINWLGGTVLPPGDNKVVALDNTKLLNTGWNPQYRYSMEAITKTLEEIINED